MIRQKASAAVLVIALAVSFVLIGWSITSTRHAWHSKKVATGAINSATAELLPPKLNSKEAKASLFYPAMKIRGPQPGGKLVAKPLTSDSRGPEVR